MSGEALPRCDRRTRLYEKRVFALPTTALRPYKAGKAQLA